MQLHLPRREGADVERDRRAVDRGGELRRVPPDEDVEEVEKDEQTDREPDHDLEAGRRRGRRDAARRGRAEKR
ncbi:MAG TPA: hypothetical protein VEK11_15750 [Thermoanaerobaculia bacterium]|nr:hypothetical protein [Thermoanaerobaculia bacterium]